MIGMGMSEWFADAMVGVFQTLRRYGDFTTLDVETVTGHPARSYQTFARDFAQVFGGAKVEATTA